MGLCLLFVGVSNCRAVMGVADTVIISGDLTDAWKWPRELLEWRKVEQLGDAQLNKLEDIEKILGDASKAVSKVAVNVSKVTDSLALLSSLKDVETYAQGAMKAQLPGGKAPELDETQKVSGSLDIFGAKKAREELRYKASAILLSLRKRQQEAAAELEAVVKAELTVQKDLLGRLKGAASVLDVQAVQAAMAASQQRLELAQVKVGQVGAESEGMEARARLEKEQREEADREWADKIADKLRARALTALHAQTGRNL